MSVRSFVCYQLYFRDWLFSFFLIFGTKKQNGNVQNLTEPDFQNNFFPAENAGKTGFWAISRDFINSFFQIYCTKMHINNGSNMAESDFEKKIFPAENAGNCCSCRFFSHFSLSYRCFFTLKHY